MWTELLALLAEFDSAVLTARDADGYPFSARCQPQPDPASQSLRLQLAPSLPLQAGPASLLCHRHDEQLWGQKSFLVRGQLQLDGGEAIFLPRQFVPGAGLGGLRGMIGFMVRSRRAAASYLAARGLPRPSIPWSDINAIKAEVDRPEH
jgi:hypothetical protein